MIVKTIWRKSLTVLLLIAMILLNVSKASAIKEGLVAPADSSVVAIFFGKYGNSSRCSGVYLRERIVLTAAHCILERQISIGDVTQDFPKWLPFDYFVSNPGINWKEGVEQRVRVISYFIPRPYEERWETTYPGRERDIAFLFLEKPLLGAPIIKIATREMVEFAQLRGQKLQVFGYGNVDFQILNDGTPFYAEIRARYRKPERLDIDGNLYSSSLGMGQGSVCPGDSGGPIILQLDQDKYLYGITFGGGTQTCHFGTPHFGNWSVESTMVWPYVKLIETEYESFLLAEAEAQAAAELKAKQEAEAEAKAAAELKAKQEAEAEAKAAAELKAKQEAEAKAKAGAAKKKSTITCIKGKKVNKVTAVNPKCPSGYKKK